MENLRIHFSLNSYICLKCEVYVIISEFLLILVWNNLQCLGVKSDMQYEQSHIQNQNVSMSHDFLVLEDFFPGNQHGAYTGMAFPHRIYCIDRALLLFQVSRSIGDAYLKNVEFNREPLLSKFRLPEPFYRPILKAEPTISVQKLFPEDQFLIFASDGLWEHLSNQEAVDIVQSCPHNVRIPIYSFESLLYIGWIFYHGFVSN